MLGILSPSWQARPECDCLLGHQRTVKTLDRVVTVTGHPSTVLIGDLAVVDPDEPQPADRGVATVAGQWLRQSVRSLIVRRYQSVVSLMETISSQTSCSSMGIRTVGKRNPGFLVRLTAL